MKYLFDLQLFADEAGAGKSETETSNEKKEDDPSDKEQQNQNNDKKYSDKDLDEIIGRKFAKWQKDQEKAISEAKKLEKMNAEEKAKYERDKLQKELDSYKKKDAIAAMSKEARKMLSEQNITIDDNLLSFMVTDDAEATKKAVGDFANAFGEAVENAVKERLKGNTPRKSSASTKPMTKEEIMAIRDPELRQKKMLENKHLFNF